MWERLSSVWDSIEDGAEFASIYLLPFAIATVLMSVVNNLVLIALKASHPPEIGEYIRVCLQPMIAAVQEPITSKLIGSILVLYIAGRKTQTWEIQSNPFKFSLLGGLTVGVVESLGVMIPSLTLNVAALLPILMHMTTGAVIATVVFKYGNRPLSPQDALNIVAATVFGILIHILWNTRIAFWIAGVNPC